MGCVFPIIVLELKQGSVGRPELVRGRAGTKIAQSTPNRKNAPQFIRVAFGFGSYVNKLQDAIDDYGNPFAQYSDWFQNHMILTVLYNDSETVCCL